MALSSVCYDGETACYVRLDCCDREAIDWAASTGGYDKATVQDVILGAIENALAIKHRNSPSSG